MVETPAEIPVTTPVVGLIVAIPVALLAHIPPVKLSASVAVESAHNDVAPVIAGTYGNG